MLHVLFIVIVILLQSLTSSVVGQYLFWLHAIMMFAPFFHNVACQKLLKSANVSRSYLK